MELTIESLSLDVDKTSVNDFVPKILIVEDDITFRPLWESMLRKTIERFELTWISQEEEAENHLIKMTKHGQKYDLVIVDIFLSHSKTGIDIWKKFHDQVGPKIIITSSVDYNKFLGLIKDHSRIPFFLQKPYDLDMTLSALHFIIQRAYNEHISKEDTFC